MARYDKYDPYVGGFRAPLAADWVIGDLEKPYGVGLNSAGAVVKGNGATGILGVLVLTKIRLAGDIVDIMTAGEITEFGPTAATPGTTFGVAATNYIAAADGTIAAGTGTVTAAGPLAVTGAAAAAKIGCTVEASRIIVRVIQGAGL